MNSCPTCGSPKPNEEWDWTKPPVLLTKKTWDFEKRAFVTEPVNEISVIHNKLVLALVMLRELGYRAEFDRLAEKFVKEKK